MLKVINLINYLYICYVIKTRENMKLISMTTFVEHQNMQEPYNFKGKVLKYSRFLKQPLKLEMFVPCDENGNILEHPIYTTNHSDECYCKGCEEETKRCSDLQDQYHKAKEKVLFEGVDYCKKMNELRFDGIIISIKSFKFMTIESLVYSKISLSKNATKQFL